MKNSKNERQNTMHIYCIITKDGKYIPRKVESRILGPIISGSLHIETLDFVCLTFERIGDP